jgi:hypothetical protein
MERVSEEIAEVPDVTRVDSRRLQVLPVQSVPQGSRPIQPAAPAVAAADPAEDDDEVIEEVIATSLDHALDYFSEGRPLRKDRPAAYSGSLLIIVNDRPVERRNVLLRVTPEGSSAEVVAPGACGDVPALAADETALLLVLTGGVDPVMALFSGAVTATGDLNAVREFVSTLDLDPAKFKDYEDRLHAPPPPPTQSIARDPPRPEQSAPAPRAPGAAGRAAQYLGNVARQIRDACKGLASGDMWRQVGAATEREALLRRLAELKEKNRLHEERRREQKRAAEAARAAPQSKACVMC